MSQKINNGDACGLPSRQPEVSPFSKKFSTGSCLLNPTVITMFGPSSARGPRRPQL